jgi:hypothetical protein
MADEDEGPDPTSMLQPPGFLALNYGPQTPLTTLAARMVYGSQSVPNSRHPDAGSPG